MTNIWRDSFEEVRKPFFEMEDPYTLREKKEKEEEDDKPKRWWDDDGDGVGYEKGEVSGKFKKSKKKVKESFETLVEVDKAKSHNDKVDVKKSVQNTIVINPEMKEQVEEWIGELVEEGYDLSQFTWDEMFEIYESAEVEQLDEAGTSGMPPTGDAERVTTGDQRMLSAKRRAAQAQIRADLARVQLQRASTAESFDSIVEYLSQRPNAFENIEEAVFDPKKSKMRPASQRSEKSMTPAQRAAAKREQQRTAEIHSKGETALAGLRSTGKTGKVKTTPSPKPEAPEANRTVKGRKDKLASAASKVLKDLKK